MFKASGKEPDFTSEVCRHCGEFMEKRTVDVSGITIPLECWVCCNERCPSNEIPF